MPSPSLLIRIQKYNLVIYLWLFMFHKSLHFKIFSHYWGGVMVQQLSMFAILVEDLSSDPKTHTGHIKTACNSSSWRSDVFFWSLRAPVLMCTWTHTETYICINNKINLKNIFISLLLQGGLELQVAVSHPVWGLRTTLTHWTIFLALLLCSSLGYPMCTKRSKSKDLAAVAAEIPDVFPLLQCALAFLAQSRLPADPAGTTRGPHTPVLVIPHPFLSLIDGLIPSRLTRMLSFPGNL